MEHKHTEHNDLKKPINHLNHNSGKKNSEANHNHNKHKGHSISMFKKRFFVSLLLTIPVLFFSPMIQNFLNISYGFSGDMYLLFGISTIVFFYGGYPFLKGAKDEILDKAIGMMTLISLAIVVAYIYSSMVVFGFKGKTFFWELVTLIDIMLLGHWIEMKSVMGASMALQKLAALIPDTANLLNNGNTKEIPTSQLKDDDIILVKPGEKIPTDGIVIQGESFVNESMLTGESKPVTKIKDNNVIGGSFNGDGSLQIKVKGVGDSSYLSKVINLVKQAQLSKSKTQALADKAAFWLTIIAISAGIATFIIWYLSSFNLEYAVERTATVLVITCPHALGLAIPLVVAISTTISAQNGLLIRNRTAFENSRKITTVVFDKTGTLTKGTFGVQKIFSFDNNFDEQKILKMFAMLEKHSEHPIAKAILTEATNRNISLDDIQKFKAIKGKGVEGFYEDKKISIASPGYVIDLGFDIPDETKNLDGTTVFLVSDDNLIGALNMTDEIREESMNAIQSLKKYGIKVWLLTGDNKISAKHVSDKLNLDGYFAEVLPDMKQEKIKELQSDGEFVAMVGDGINDAPALAQANVGIAIGSGTEIAAETADIILVNSNPHDIYTLISFGKSSYNKMIQNLIWAAGYNVFAIPLAAGVLYPFGIILSPAIGAVLMSLSTVIVAINAKLLQIEKT